MGDKEWAEVWTGLVYRSDRRYWTSEEVARAARAKVDEFLKQEEWDWRDAKQWTDKLDEVRHKEGVVALLRMIRRVVG